MLHNLTVGQYIPGNSFLHRLDPRIKLVVSALAMICLFVIVRLDVLAAIGLLLLLLSGMASLPVSYLLKGLRVIWLLCLLTLAFNAFLTPGTPRVSLLGLSLTDEGLWRGAQMAIRLVLLVLISSIVSLTTSPIVLTDGVEKLLAPFTWLGIPSHELAMVSTIALRFVPTLANETERIMNAQMARGACLDRGGLIVRMRALLPVLVPLFVSAFRYAEDLAIAMEARCYRGGEGRTRLRELRLTYQDWLWGLLFCLGLALLIVLDWWLRKIGFLCL